MPALRTHPGRAVLAILAGAISAPIFVVLAATGLHFISGGINPPAGSDPTDTAQTLALIAGLGVVIGGPIALVAIVVLFGPLWVLHRRFDGGPWSFIAMAAFAGLLMVGVMAWISRDNNLPDATTVCLFTGCAALSGGVMWLVAYAGARRTEINVRALPQANFTATEQP